MNFHQIMLIELTKTKRSKILPLILVPPLLVVISGIANISVYLAQNSGSAWEAMFVQSALLFGYYLLPFSMVIVCVMIAGRETQNNGMLKMLSLPVSRKKIALAKFFVLLIYLALELIIFFAAFAIAGLIAVRFSGINDPFPFVYILKWSGILFSVSLPVTAVMWMLSILFEKTGLAIGLNILLIIPGILVANTSYWSVYPYCYNGYIISCEMQRLTTGMADIVIEPATFPLYAIVILICGLLISITRYGKKEMR